MTLKNTDNSYIIEVDNTQTVDNAADTVSERAACGYYEKNNKKYLLYKVTNNDIVSSVIIICEGDKVIIRRTGEVESNMHFIENSETASMYVTPYGKLPIKILTQKISVNLDSSGGEIRLRYTLIIQGDEYYNDMRIKVIGDR